MKRVSTKSVGPWAVVEITSGSDERERTELIRAAYRSSRSGVVALALRGVSRHVVDRALDPVVDMRQDCYRGVVYMDADKPGEELLAAANHASIVIAASEGFRNELRQHGIEAIGVEDGARFLAAPELH